MHASELRFKGVSPLVATVLLIAFVIAVGGIVAVWANSFATSQTQLVGQQATISTTCSYGHIAAQNLKFQSASSRLSGTIVNTGTIALGNLTLNIIYQNATSQTIGLCTDPTGSASCSVGNLSLAVSDQVAFNVTIWGPNFESGKIRTNCSSSGFPFIRGDIGPG